MTDVGKSRRKETSIQEEEQIGLETELPGPYSRRLRKNRPMSFSMWAEHSARSKLFQIGGQRLAWRAAVSFGIRIFNVDAKSQINSKRSTKRDLYHKLNTRKQCRGLSEDQVIRSNMIVRRAGRQDGEEENEWLDQIECGYSRLVHSGRAPVRKPSSRHP